MQAQYTMTSEGYGCEMRKFKIDGISFENVGNPTFEKR